MKTERPFNEEIMPDYASQSHIYVHKKNAVKLIHFNT